MYRNDHRLLFFQSDSNAWQSLAYSPLRTVVSPPSEYLWNTLTYWSPPCLAAPPLLNVGLPEVTAEKFSTPTVQVLIFLNSAVTEPNLTKFLQGIQKLLPITLLKSKLWSSNPFWNDQRLGLLFFQSDSNEDRRQIAGESRQKLRVLSPNLVNFRPTISEFTLLKVLTA